MLDTVVGWLAKAILAALKALWGLLAETAFISPDVTVLPQVATISGRSQLVVNTVFVLAIVAVGVVVMTHETVQARYGVGDLVPRLVVGFIAANFATPICSNLIQTANALTGALTGDGITVDGSFSHMQHVVTDVLADETNSVLLIVVGLIIAVLTGMLLVVWLVRIGVLIVLVGIAPVALACHATPFTDGAARLWWRSILGVLATVMLQAFAMHTALSIFLDSNASFGVLGVPRDSTGTLNLFIVACLLWVTVKIPGLMRRLVLRGGQHSSAGLFLRMLLIQQVSHLVRLPLRRRGTAAVGAAAGRGGRAATAAGEPSVATAVIPYWRPRMPMPASGGVRAAVPAPAGTPPAGTPPTGPAVASAAAGTGRRPAAGPSVDGPSSRLRGRVVPSGATPATVMPLRRPMWKAHSARPSGTGWPDPAPGGSTPRRAGWPPAGAAGRPSGTGWPSTRVRPTGDPRYPMSRGTRAGGQHGRWH